MIRILRSAAVLPFAALAVSACQTARTEPPQTQAQTQIQATAPAVEPAAAAPATPAPVPQLTLRAPEPPIDDDPRQLIGLDRRSLAAVLGDPALIRREAPAEIWQYVTNECVFDVVLYARGQGYAVSYLEARDTTAAVRDARPCLNAVLRARQAAPVS